MRTALIFMLGSVVLAMAQEKSTLLGFVRDAQTQQPIQGARVYLSPYDLRLPDPLFPTLHFVTDSFIGFQTTTDAAGRYRFDGLPPHRYYIGAEKSGHCMCEGKSGVTRTFAGRSVERDLGLDQTARLRVRLVDRSTGGTIDGVHVNLLRREYVAGIQQVTAPGGPPHPRGPQPPAPPPTEFEVCPRSDIYLEISPNETDEKITVGDEQNVSAKPFYGRGYYPDGSDIGGATPIGLAPGDDRTLEIRIEKQIPRAVRVEIQGAPEDSLIHLALERRTRAWDYFPSRLATAQVRAKDPVRLERLSAANYTLIAWTDDAPGSRFGIIKKFSVSNSRDDTLRLNLQPTIKGLVQTDEASAGKAVEGWFDLSAVGRAETHDHFWQVRFRRGEAFQIDGLLPGEYSVYIAAPPDWIASKVQCGAVDAILHAFTLDRASPPVEVTLSRKFGAVTGKVTDGSQPVDEAVLVLVPLPVPEGAEVYTFPQSHLDENGRYDFRYIAPGRYRVIPFYGNTLSEYNDARAIRDHAKGYREVIVRPGKTCAGVDFAIGQ